MLLQQALVIHLQSILTPIYYQFIMTNEDALNELKIAVEHIKNAEYVADSRMTKREIENLHIACEDVISGILTDIHRKKQ